MGHAILVVQLALFTTCLQLTHLGSTGPWIINEHVNDSLIDNCI